MPTVVERGSAGREPSGTAHRVTKAAAHRGWCPPPHGCACAPGAQGLQAPLSSSPPAQVVRLQDVDSTRRAHDPGGRGEGQPGELVAPFEPVRMSGGQGAPLRVRRDWQTGRRPQHFAAAAWRPASFGGYAPFTVRYAGRVPVSSPRSCLFLLTQESTGLLNRMPDGDRVPHPAGRRPLGAGGVTGRPFVCHCRCVRLWAHWPPPGTLTGSRERLAEAVVPTIVHPLPYRSTAAGLLG